jgi:hypothetical protein
MHGGEPTAGTLLEHDLAAVGQRVPPLGDHRVAIDASDIEDRIGAPAKGSRGSMKHPSCEVLLSKVAPS